MKKTARFPSLLVAALLLAGLLLPRSGLAATRHVGIGELQEQAQSAWQESFLAHGRTIQVDVLPHVPSVLAFPVLQTRYADLKPQPDPDGRFGIQTREKDGYVLLYTCPDGVLDPRGYVTGKVWYQGFDWNAPYLPGENQTLQDMVHMIVDAMEKSDLDPGIVYLDRLQSLRQNIYEKPGGGREALPGLLSLSCYQALRGIPVVADKTRAFLSSKRPVTWSYFSPFPRLGARIKGREAFEAYFIDVLEETLILADDVPLAGFDTILQTLTREIKEGRLRQLFSLTLGYASFSESIPDRKNNIRENEVFYALPVWAVDCIYVEGPKVRLRNYDQWEDSLIDPYNVLEYRRLLINAQTGQLFDPTNQSLKRELYAGFLSWDDVR